MSALHELSMTEAADAVARGEVTATALTESCLARIAAHDGKVNSVIRLDRDSALEQAAAVDAARKAGKALGPLGGVPMMHKDMYYRAGKVSTCGSKIRRDFAPKVTATVLEKLDAAGAIDMGTLNMAEFAQNPTGHNGRCRAVFLWRAWVGYRRLHPPAGDDLRRDGHQRHANAGFACGRYAAFVFR